MTLIPDQAHHDDDQGAGLVRMPPQAVDAEKSVLGSMTMSKQAAVDCADILQPEDYYRPAHQIIHTAILDLFAKGEPTDPISLAAELRKRGDLDRIGGAVYLHELVQSVDTPANGSYHAEIVRERAILRRLADAGVRITQSRAPST